MIVCKLNNKGGNKQMNRSVETQNIKYFDVTELIVYVKKMITYCFDIRGDSICFISGIFINFIVIILVSKLVVYHSYSSILGFRIFIYVVK